MKKNYCAGVVTLKNSGRAIGPYFIGISFDAIEEKFGSKIANNNFEILEYDIDKLRGRSDFKSSIAKLADGYIAVMLK